MNKYIPILFFLLCSMAIYAQDTIVKRNGEKLAVKLIEINPNEVKYKRLDYLEGPLFMVPKQDISFLIYSNGVKESYENYIAPEPKPNMFFQDLTIQPSGKYYYYKERKLTEKDMLAVAKSRRDEKINLMVKVVEKDRFIQNITSDASLVLGVSGLYLYAKNQPRRGRKSPSGTTGATTSRPTATSAQLQGQKTGEYLMLASLAFEAVSISFIFERRKNARILVGVYNRAIAVH